MFPNNTAEHYCGGNKGPGTAMPMMAIEGRPKKETVLFQLHRPSGVFPDGTAGTAV